MTDPKKMTNEEIAETVWKEMVLEEDMDGIQLITKEPIVKALDLKDTEIADLQKKLDVAVDLVYKMSCSCSSDGITEATCERCQFIGDL